jgi:malate dehydrogenase (oxaloacetate-decarboxylating)
MKPKAEIAKQTNREMQSGILEEIMKEKDVFIGFSAPNIVTADMVKT